jgi:hypothetical protein
VNSWGLLRVGSVPTCGASFPIAEASALPPGSALSATCKAAVTRTKMRDSRVVLRLRHGLATPLTFLASAGAI